MAYKRYIKKGGKVYGPYIYQSHKKDGKVVSKYLGKHKEKKKLKDFFGSSVKKSKGVSVSAKGGRKQKRFLKTFGGNAFKKIKQTKISGSSVHRSVYPKLYSKGHKRSEGAKSRASTFSSRWNRAKVQQVPTSFGVPPIAGGRGKPKDHKINFSKKFLLFGLGGLFILLCLAFLVNIGLTGKVSLDIKSKYTPGEAIKGNLKFSLKEGELIPADSKLIIDFGGFVQEFALSDLIDDGGVEGDFYAENTAISGTGLGYGVAGSKKIYPDVDFDLRIFNSGDELIEEETPVIEENITGETPVDEPEEPVVEENATEEVSKGNVTEEIVEEEPEETIKPPEVSEDSEEPSEEQQVEEETGVEELVKEQGSSESTTSEETQTKEQLKEEKQTEKSAKKEEKNSEKSGKKESLESESDSESSEESSESSGGSGESSSESSGGESSPESSSGGSSEGGASPITGEAIAESEEIVSGTVSKGNKFTYNYGKGKTAELISGAVTVNGSVINDSFVKVNTKKKNVVVSTNYFIEEEGFGEEYVGKKKLNLKIKLKQFGLVVENDSELVVLLVYDNETLVEASKDLTVGEEGEEEVIEENVTTETNLTQVNITQANITETNITVVNETVVEVNVSDEMSINTTQYGAILNKPVKWKKAIKLDEARNVTVELPKEATNITVYQIDNTGEEDAQDSEQEEVQNESEGAQELEDASKSTEFGGITAQEVSENKTSEVEISNKTKKKSEKKERTMITAQIISGEIISGEVSAEIELEEGSSFVDFFRNIFNTITGRVIEVEEKENVTHVVIDENATEFEIEYETPAPVAFEANTSKGKQIVISSETHYENILAFTELPKEVPASVVKLYRFTEKNVTEDIFEEQCGFDNETNATICENVTIGKTVLGVEDVRERVNVSTYDLDNDSLVDYIEWVVPHLSNQTYELELSILNVQSYPTVGGNWTVRFNTTGEANLTISAYDGTTYGFEGQTSIEEICEFNETTNETICEEIEKPIDLEYLETKCGNETLDVYVSINGTKVPYDIYLKKKRIEDIRRELNG